MYIDTYPSKETHKREVFPSKGTTHMRHTCETHMRDTHARHTHATAPSIALACVSRMCVSHVFRMCVVPLDVSHVCLAKTHMSLRVSHVCLACVSLCVFCLCVAHVCLARQNVATAPLLSHVCLACVSRMCVSPVCLMCVVPLDGNTSLLWVSFDGYVSMYMICSRMCVSQRALSKKYLSFVGLLAQRPLRDTHAEQRRCSDVLPGCRV